VSHLGRELVIQKLSAALAARPEILEAYLFGSLARGDDQPHSDVDVAVFVTEAALGRPGFGYGAELNAELQQTLGRSDVDILVLNGAAPVLYYAVLRDGVRLLSRELAATTRREGQAYSRYCDDVPRLRRIDAIHHARIAAGEFGK
jgi:predicted nucleotidyltransferase